MSLFLWPHSFLLGTKEQKENKVEEGRGRSKSIITKMVIFFSLGGKFSEDLNSLLCTFLYFLKYRQLTCSVCHKNFGLGWPGNQRVADLIPSQGTCLGCGPG